MRTWEIVLVLTLLGVGRTRATAQDEPADRNDKSVAATTLQDDLEEDIELLELEVPVVVTASRHEEKITRVPQAISVITAEEIRRSGARSIPDALRLVSGVDVADLSMGNAAVSTRGFHGFLSRQLLVLVDGRQIFDSHFGGTLWGSWPFQLEDIERIEVIRGPGGVTWGANAVNGVVNIITKDPADQLGLTITLGGGSRGTQKEHIGYAFKEGKLRMRVSGEFEGGDGFKNGGSMLRGLEDDYKGGRMALHGIYEASENDTLTFSAGSAVIDGGFPPTPLAGVGLRRNSEAQANYVLGRWSHRIAEDNYFELTGYVNDFQASPGETSIDYRYQQLALQFGHTFKPAEAHTLSWGIDTRVDLLDASNSSPGMLADDFVSSEIIGVYVQDEWRLAPRWKLNLGGRLDYESFTGFQPSARAALSYDLSDDALVYGAVSRAFQMPPAGLRFLDLPLLNGIARAQADRDARVESLVAYELGFRGRYFKRLDVSANAFWHEYDDLTTLHPGLGPPGLLKFQFDNRAEASLYGLELDARYALTERLTLLANYTYEELRWRSSDTLHDKDLISPPKHKSMLGVRYSPTDDLHLSSNLFFVDAVEGPNPAFSFVSRRIDPYLRLDLRAEYEFWKDQASVSIGVRNLLDSSHPEGTTLFLNDAEVPRMVFAEFRLSLQ